LSSASSARNFTEFSILLQAAGLTIRIAVGEQTTL
jgi:hypothetical protein